MAEDAHTAPVLSAAYPQIFVSDMAAAAAFFSGALGFTVVFTYGDPPFYAQVRRDRARLNLRHVDQAVFAGDIRNREDLLAVLITVDHVDALYREYQSRGLAFHQPLKTQPWGAQDFVVSDPDGNLIGFSSRTDLQD
jgi:catechol 2,3-dioxygenase-like lactoylglutathione lyase family enzyme